VLTTLPAPEAHRGAGRPAGRRNRPVAALLVCGPARSL